MVCSVLLFWSGFCNPVSWTLVRPNDTNILRRNLLGNPEYQKDQKGAFLFVAGGTDTQPQNFYQAIFPRQRFRNHQEPGFLNTVNPLESSESRLDPCRWLRRDVRQVWLCGQQPRNICQKQHPYWKENLVQDFKKQNGGNPIRSKDSPDCQTGAKFLCLAAAWHENLGLTFSNMVCNRGPLGRPRATQPNSDDLQPNSHGLQSNSNGLQPNGNGLQPHSNGLQSNSNGLQPKPMASNLVAMASNLIAMASNLLAMASNQITMASNLIAIAYPVATASNLIASNLIAMASNLMAMASNRTIAMASNLIATASSLLAMASNL